MLGLGNERPDQFQLKDAERKYYEHISKPLNGSQNCLDSQSMNPVNNIYDKKLTVMKINKKSKNKKNVVMSEESKELLAIKSAKMYAKTNNDKENTNKIKQLNNTELEAIITDPEILSEGCAFKKIISKQQCENIEKSDVKKKKKERSNKVSIENVSSNLIANSESTLSPTVLRSTLPTAEIVVEKFTKGLKEAKEKMNRIDRENFNINSVNDENVEDNGNANKNGAGGGADCTLASEIAKARQHIKNSLERMDGIAAYVSTPGKDFLERISTLEKDNHSLREVVECMKKQISQSECKIKQLEIGLQKLFNNVATVNVSDKQDNCENDVDLFDSDEDEAEDAVAMELREKRLAEYAAKKSKKPALIAKSNVILDIKPWDDETDMKVMETKVREIVMDGLLWGAAKLVPLAYGIHKLQISCVVEDEKVSIDELTETIEGNEEYVQSVDVAAFNKI